ncbi:PIG-L deacetylase family protein [Shewanella phaeophyticola]|uniref:PIG-L family deacetylase n=1 Tax=Shewanella phaeophyticola TaxID=2978345 RepID=A0ABT2P7N7_9GAMM|nr:PIG-L deacetylase family protein [Shewanella sp. KJ10-1]MCT8987251.1 PIG-L family deacetylase [Shewanella sp. KJ10-1]
MKSVLIVAPHADDETLGCGGSILKFVQAGYEVHWLLVTGMSKSSGFTTTQIATRKKEIAAVTLAYGFSSINELMLPAGQLETLPMNHIVEPISDVVSKIKPEQVFTVYRNDAHTDHKIVFDAVMSATKSFRYPFVKKVLAYETLSETDFGLKPEDGGFKPNVFIDVSLQLEKKLTILEMYPSEIAPFPFPRSRKALESLAYVRGVQANVEAAEAFVLIKEIL